MATRSNSGPDELNEQAVPKPDGYEGSNDDAWVLTGQDGRLGYEPGAGKITSLEELKGLRNLREIDKH